jgi:hypothetical protein
MGRLPFALPPLPRLVRIRQRFDATEVESAAQAVAAELARPEIAPALKPGARVAVGVGSRGIDRLAEVVTALVGGLGRAGCQPFIVSAMGSHGGATPEGQAAVLAGYGVTEAALGVPVRATLETEVLGEVLGVPVHFDRLALQEADAIVPVNRVKPHTSFRARIESGLMKMIAIGLGNHAGAEALHAAGFDRFHEIVPAAAELILARAPIPFGMALVENAYGRLARIEAVPAPGMREREEALLDFAHSLLPALPYREVEVLLIDRIGKDVSGAGMDPNVVNRHFEPVPPSEPHAQRIVVRGLTAASKGNAAGIGLADFVLRRAADAVDIRKTLINSITARHPEGARMPVILEDDREALAVALAACVRVPPSGPRIARIPDTKHIATLEVTENLLAEALATGRVERAGEPREWKFDTAGMLVDLDADEQG